MIHFGAIQIKVGRILRMHAAFIEGVGGPSRTKAEHHQPRFGELIQVIELSITRSFDGSCLRFLTASNFSVF